MNIDWEEVKDFLQEKKFGVILILSAAIIGVGVCFFFQNHQQAMIPNTNIENSIGKTTVSSKKLNSTKESVEQKIFVDIKGEVNRPDVYEVSTKCRVIDVVKLAGGFKKDADQTQVNLSQKVADEMCIVVPKIGESPRLSEVESVDTGISKNGEQEKERININTATLEEMQKITGIGPKKAEAIIEYREENGRFEKVEDLSKISGIGEKTVEKIKDEITVE